jgi:hypothetical protein
MIHRQIKKCEWSEHVLYRKTDHMTFFEYNSSRIIIIFAIVLSLILDFRILNIMNNHISWHMIIYDALLRLIINSTYLFIKSLRVLLDRFLVLNQTQYQCILYAQLSSLQKLKIKYAAVFNKDLDRFELRILFFVILWWKLSIIIIVNIAKIAIITHDRIMKKCSHLTIFTNDIDIDNQIEIFAMTIIFSTSDIFSIMMNKKQIYLKSIIEITIYSEKIMKLDLVLNIMKLDLVLNIKKNYLKDRFIVIFTNCQIAIRIIQCFRKQFD